MLHGASNQQRFESDVPPTDEAGDLLEYFIRHAEGAASVVHLCRRVGDVEELVRKLAVNGDVSVSGSLFERFPAIGKRLASSFDPIRPSTAEEAARAVVGVAVGEAMVVETGSILVAEHQLEDRLISMLSPILVQVVSADAILPGMDEVGEFLARRHDGGMGGYHVLVTGPSRSADIERSLTIGVQGPSEVHIAILFDDEEAEVE